MKLILCTIYDRATESYGRPIYVNHNGEAIRSFMEEANNKESSIGKYPGDYELFRIGVYETDTGMIDQSGVERLARATDLVKQS